MARTVAEIVTAVGDNLGDRTGGRIGSRTVEEVALADINTCLVKIAKGKKHIPALEKIVQLTLSSGTYQYTVPTTDILSATVRVKKFLSWVIYKNGETVGYNVRRLIAGRRDQLFPLTNTNHTGRPFYYSIYGTQIEVYPMPDATYIMKGRAIVWPNTVTLGSSSTGLGDEFDDVIEEYVTMSCFSRLQQPEDAALWYSRYERDLRATMAALDDYPDEEWFPVGQNDLIGDMAHLQPTSLHTNDYNSALGIGS